MVAPTVNINKSRAHCSGRTFALYAVPAAIRALLLTPRQEVSKLGSPRYRLQISQYPLTYMGRPSDFVGGGIGLCGRLFVLLIYEK